MTRRMWETLTLLGEPFVACHGCLQEHGDGSGAKGERRRCQVCGLQTRYWAVVTPEAAP